MGRRSLEEVYSIMRRVRSSANWASMVRESHKITMKSSHGPSVVLTYTGAISVMGNPGNASVAFFDFMKLMVESFREQESTRVLAHLARVVKPEWNFSIIHVY